MKYKDNITVPYFFFEYYKMNNKDNCYIEIIFEYKRTKYIHTITLSLNKISNDTIEVSYDLNMIEVYNTIENTTIVLYNPSNVELHYDHVRITE